MLWQYFKGINESWVHNKAVSSSAVHGKMKQEKRENLINTALKENNAINANHPGFMENRLWQRTFPIFFDEVTKLIDKSNHDNVIYLDSCKAFDSVPDNILIRKLEWCKNQYSRHNIEWIKNWLTDRFRNVIVNKDSVLCESVADGSLHRLWLVLFKNLTVKKTKKKIKKKKNHC